MTTNENGDPAIPHQGVRTLSAGHAVLYPGETVYSVLFVNPCGAGKRYPGGDFIPLTPRKAFPRAMPIGEPLSPVPG